MYAAFARVTSPPALAPVANDVDWNYEEGTATFFKAITSDHADPNLDITDLLARVDGQDGRHAGLTSL